MTLPEPVPELPLTMVRKGLRLSAVHPQLVAPVLTTVNVTVPPLGCGTVTFVGVTSNAHPDIPSCSTVMVRPAIVSVPKRAAPVLAEAAAVTDPEPIPELPL